MAQPRTASPALAVVAHPLARAGARAASGGRLSSVAIAAIVLAALVVLACLAWGAARVLTFEPRWTLSLRHALAEAGLRASATWAEIADWARLGK